MKFVFFIIGFGWMTSGSFAMAAQTHDVPAMHRLLEESENERGLLGAVQDYRYSMSVEWDQRDLEAKKEIENRLLSRVQTLLTQGMSNSNAFLVLSTIAKDRQTRIDIEMCAKYSEDHKLSQETFLSLFLEWVNRIHPA